MKRLIAIAVALSLCVQLVLPLAVPSLAFASSLIGSLSDPQDLAIDDFLDILSARVEQDGGYLKFVIEARGAIPAVLGAPADSITYLWFVDTDNNPATGQPHGTVGSDFNVRAVVSDIYGGGFIDVAGSMPGGGMGQVAIQGNQIEVSLGMAQIGSPAQFHWRCATFRMGDNVYVDGNAQTEVVVSNVLPYTPPARVTITNPLLMLSTSGPASAALTVEIRDATGSLLNNADYHLTFFSTNEAVATVDAAGVVTAHSAPAQFSDTPYIIVWADFVPADNSAVVRVTDTDLNVVHQIYGGTNVVYYLPASIEGLNLNQITTDYQVVAATDQAYLAQQTGFGTTPFNGGKQYLVLDVGDVAATVPCGLSGNPIRLGWEYGKPQDNSGYIINVPGNRVPQWFVIFHEMGHNFNGASQSFNQFINAYNSTQNATYSEGLASLVAMWSWKYLERYGEGLGQLALSSIDSGFGNSETYFRQTLDSYRMGGSGYATMDANVLDGILMEMYDAYGTGIWFDLFSTFLPAQVPLPIAIDTEAKQATWLVAALSASVGQDLRSRFASQYGFPIDNDAWPEILAAVQARIAARDFLAPLHLSLKAGWNMVSVPLQLSDNSTGAVFPGAAAVFAWNPVTKSYITPTTIEPHKGYWVAVSQDMNLTLTAIPVDEWTADLSAGWNMVGSASGNASLATPDDSPDNSVMPTLYWWNPLTKSYMTTSTVEPGKGYWVAAVRDCALTLP